MANAKKQSQKEIQAKKTKDKIRAILQMNPKAGTTSWRRVQWLRTRTNLQKETKETKEET